MKLITDHNVDPNLYDAEGNTPLIKCVQKIIQNKNGPEVMIAKLLIEKGANPSLVNKKGDSALRLCMQNKINELITIMWKGFSFKEDPKAFFSFEKDIMETSI